ncbi:MAG: hypothetical protein DRN37_06120 [Thermoplasmata archaeon]|nr:MAG: hypothetical protein B1H13_03525 [Desulfobacteraceae bacterium 4484_190.3]RLB18081.1 MAG: hypothetical protein DRG82_04885 [Deltaproteobacteria bacterium]RLF57653.1 MAG: hypothetical protein DRN37_06120 [Thermoplasmata archaeon]
MEIECPACRKINPTNRKCPRCGCDLSSLWNLLECAERELRRGAEQLKNNNGLPALEHAKRAWGINKSARAAKLAFLACILAMRFDEATVWCRRATGKKVMKVNGV